MTLTVAVILSCSDAVANKLQTKSTTQGDTVDGNNGEKWST